jgi:hypothetical protein
MQSKKLNKTVYVYVQSRIKTNMNNLRRKEINFHCFNQNIKILSKAKKQSSTIKSVNFKFY